ncbi:MAG: hypothetical protein ACJASZ_001414 [Yoonia sp.]
MLLLRDLVTTSGVELVRHLQHPERKIPPRYQRRGDPCNNASPNAAQHPTARDRAIAQIKAQGRMAWRKTSGYNQRSRGETLMGRWKAVIGPKLKARSFENQKTEARIGVRILNQMIELGRPNFERTA